VRTWPVERAAAGVATAEEVLETVGPADEAFPLASVTKLFSAYAVLVATEEGTVGLDEPAGPAGSTVRHLLAHASGLPPEEGMPDHPVGRRRVYSNLGFEVAADHLADRAGIPFAEYLQEAVVAPLGLDSFRLTGSTAWGGSASLDDLLAFGRELLAPTLIAPSTRDEAVGVAFPGLAGVLPGFGRQDPNDWGLGFELRDDKSPHWTGTRNSPRTYGHFGRTGTFLWVDPEAGLTSACLTNRDFGPWAAEAWPALSDRVLSAFVR
jgi:CubicO group peptidase (beta-lactamase class C family)